MIEKIFLVCIAVLRLWKRVLILIMNEFFDKISTYNNFLFALSTAGSFNILRFKEKRQHVIKDSIYQRLRPPPLPPREPPPPPPRPPRRSPPRKDPRKEPL